MLIGILDLGINNLTSVQRAFSLPLRTKDSIFIVDKCERNFQPDLLILPGLGKFSAGMQALEERQLVEQIRDWNRAGTKVVGICLGMQLLGTSSDESPETLGLKLIESSIKRLHADSNEKVPHIGWAETKLTSGSQHFPSLSTKGDFYFVHSYHVVPNDDEHALTKTSFGNSSFVSSIYNGNILGVQFHPEKSGNKGKKLVSEIVEWARNEN